MPLTKTSSHDRPSQSATPKYSLFYTVLHFIGYGVNTVFLHEKYCILLLRGTGTVALRKCEKDVYKNQNDSDYHAGPQKRCHVHPGGLT